MAAEDFINITSIKVIQLLCFVLYCGAVSYILKFLSLQH